MLPALLLAVFLSLQLAAGNRLLTSPLFRGSLGGDSFDDGITAVTPPVARLHSILICYGDVIDGIQLVYILENNITFVAPPHGKVNDKCSSKDSNMSKIVFKESEILVHVEGVMPTWYDYISQLTLYTSVDGGPPKHRGGPFGRGNIYSYYPIRFSLTGDIRGIFGQIGNNLDAIGFYVNAAVPLSSYQKTDPIRGTFIPPRCTEFDDFRILASKNEKPFKITNMVISYCFTSIEGIQVTYLTSNGTSITLTNGALSRAMGWKRAFLTFEDDEWITTVNVLAQGCKDGPCNVNAMEIETTNSKGSVKSYGPLGLVDKWTTSNITTVRGIIYGFYGCFGDYSVIYKLGFYI